MSEGNHRISSRSDRGVLILKVEPYRIAEYELAEAIGRELIAAVDEQKATKVVVDLANVQYMGSVGYGPLITLRSRVRASGGRLVLCNMAPIIHELFDTTRLLVNPNSPKSLFEFTGSVEAAISLLQT